MIRELEPLIWIAFVVSTTAHVIVYNRMVNRLRLLHPLVRSIYLCSRHFAPNHRLYRLTFGEDRRAMRLWYWAIALNCLSVLLLVLAVTTTALRQ